MQNESKGTSKLGFIRKIHNANTPEVARKNLSDSLPNISRSGTTSRNRTVMPDDIIRIQKLPKKKIAINRLSIMPSQLSSDMQKKVDSECRELDLGLIYDKYLQTVMIEFIIKKMTKEKKHLRMTQLATVAHEINQDTKKLIKIKTREHDIINLSLIQKEIDAQLAAITKCTRDETFKATKNILLRLQSLLEPFDVLQCNDIILPKMYDEWKEIWKILTKCSNTLKSITNLVELKGKMYYAVNAELKNFAEIYNKIENLQKKLEEALCNLQISILKNTSLSLTHNGNP